jgi:hypothetical protein
MWFWPVNEMIELVSGMPAPQLGDESSWVWGSQMVQGSSGSVRSLRVPSKTSLRCSGGTLTPGWRPLIYLCLLLNYQRFRCVAKGLKAGLCAPLTGIWKRRFLTGRKNIKIPPPRSVSTSELYRPSDRRLSAKWLPTFADRGYHMVSVTSLRPYSRFSRQEPLLFYQVAPQLYSRGWVAPNKNWKSVINILLA